VTLRVALVQADLAWVDPDTNRDRLARMLAPLAGALDLVVLPEMFTTGFTMSPERHAEPADGLSARWLASQARSLNAATVGSIAVGEGGRYFNRLVCSTPDGAQRSYDKRHLFRMGGEHQHYTAGVESLLVEWRGFRIRPLVCYDLRFPVWSRRTIACDYDLLLYVANWPAARAYAWTALLRARAIENQAFVAGVNRVGLDGHGVAHSGASAALDFLGAPIAECGDSEEIRVVEFDHAALTAFRQRFPAHLDADRFTLLT
jgi:predicted amidohydrolase